MDVTAWQPVGAELTGLAVTDANAGTVGVLRQLLAEHGVLVLPGQDVDDVAFVKFLRSFGDLQFTEGETPVDAFPDLNVVSNVGRTTPPRSQFHLDTSYVRNPPAYTALRAVQVPSQGGATMFTNQYRAFETLPYDVREQLDGRTVTHVVTGVEPGEEASAEHPVFRRHTRSRAARRSTSRHRNVAQRSAGWTRRRRRGRLPTCSSTPPEPTTSCGTPGRPATSSCGTTRACCTRPTTPVSSATGSCTAGW